MADWNNPSLSDQYTNFQDYLKSRDEDAAKLFDGTGTNVPTGTIRWSSANNRFEKFDGTNWNVLATTFSINVAQLLGRTINDSGSGTGVLWTADKVQSLLNGKADTSLGNVSDSTILAKIKNVDGAGSGLDADLLDGISSSAFVRSDVDDSIGGKIRLTSNADVSLTSDGPLTIGSSSSQNISIDQNEIMSRNNGSTSDLLVQNEGGNVAIGKNISGAGVSPITVGNQNYKVWHAGNGGSGSGLDADLWDGYDSAKSLVYKGDIPNNADLNNYTTAGIYSNGSNDHGCSNAPDNRSFLLVVYNSLNLSQCYQVFRVYWGANIATYERRKDPSTGNWSAWGKLWHSENDGSGSGLDADLVDGLQASQFVRSDVDDSVSGNLTISKSTPYLTWTNTGISDVGKSFRWFSSGPAPMAIGLQGQKSDGTWIAVLSAAPQNETLNAYGHTIWHAGNDGSGSGLDADLLDGYDASAFGLKTGTLNQFTPTTADGDNTWRASGRDLLVNNKRTMVGFATADGDYLAINYAQDFSNGVHIDGTTKFTQTPNVNGSTIWHAGNDGSGSGLDADLLDGLELSEVSHKVFETPTITDSNNHYFKIATFTVNDDEDMHAALQLITKTSGNENPIVTQTTIGITGNSFYATLPLIHAKQYYFNGLDTHIAYVVTSTTAPYTVDFYVSVYQTDATISGSVISEDGNGSVVWYSNPSAVAKPSGLVTGGEYEIWHSGNDGSGSGLDADLVRGLPADFSVNKVTNGYQMLPSGIIIQWGVTGSISGDNSATVTFPISFPNAVFSVTATANASDSYDIFAKARDLTQDNFVARMEFTGSGSNGSGTIQWIAIGY